jgi:hypothetical protein
VKVSWRAIAAPKLPFETVLPTIGQKKGIEREFNPFSIWLQGNTIPLFSSLFWKRVSFQPSLLSAQPTS